MAELKTRIDELQRAAAHPEERLQYYLAQGKKVIGCFPVYVPEELVHASGMIPMGMWGGKTEWKLAKSFLPPFACPIMQSNMEFGLAGIYKGISAVIIPTLCDTFRCVSQDWRFGVKDIPMIPITYPQNRKNPASTEFLISEYETVLYRLSQITDMKMTDEALENSIKVYNAHNAVMRKFAKLANDHLDVITPVIRHAIFKSAFFYEKAEHTAIIEEINAALEALPVHNFTGKKIILTGIAAEPDGLLELFEKNGLAVVGDDLGQEMRQYRTDIPLKGGSPIRRLALQWNDRKGCSMIHEDFKIRGEMLVEMAKENGATGVIYCQMKFCDPEEYDYPICLRTLRAEGIPTLMLDIDQQDASIEQASTRVQTFAEMI